MPYKNALKICQKWLKKLKESRTINGPNKILELNKIWAKISDAQMTQLKKCCKNQYLIFSDLYKILDEKDEEIHNISRLNEQLKGFNSRKYSFCHIYYFVLFSPTFGTRIAYFIDARCR